MYIENFLARVMLHWSHTSGEDMSIGSSGRIVIEVETKIKRELYSALSLEGLTLKEWFLKSADTFISDRTQISLPLLTSEEQTLELTVNSETKNGL